MRRKTVKTIAAVLLVTTMTGATVFADDISSLTTTRDQNKSELDNLQRDMTYILNQMNDLEIQMNETTASIQQVNVELQQAEATQNQQYQDMKLRIKYMYEDQSTSIMETLLTSDSMGEVLNKAEYMQKVYDYDRDKLAEIAETAKTISEKKQDLENKQASLQSFEKDLSDKQSFLESAIDESNKKYANSQSALNSAIEAAQKKAAEEAAKKASTNALKLTGDSSIGQAAVNIAYKYIGVRYVSGGSDPSVGFDCSGFTSYVYSQLGISLSKSSGAQSAQGNQISLSEAMPGDIVCYAGHVAIYIGNGQIIHAPVPGDVVKVASVNIMRVLSVRRVW